MSIPGAGNPLLLGGAAGGYKIERSIRLNAPDSAYLSRTPASAGNRKTWTWAGWVKISRLGEDYKTIFSAIASDASQYAMLMSGQGTDLFYYWQNALQVQVGGQFRDTSAWQHLVLAVDTTQPNLTTGVKFYINGVAAPVTVTSGAYTQNTDTAINAVLVHSIGSNLPWQNRFFGGYLADIHFIDGQALDPTSFGEFDTNGIWQPKAFSGGSYGTNGFHLDFSDNSTAAALGTDTSGNGNTWTVNNISIAPGNGSYISSTTGTTSPAGTSFGNMFDGNTSTFVRAAPFSTVTFTKTFTGVTTLRVYASRLGGSLRVNGIVVPNGISSSWWTIDLTSIGSTITDISFTSGANPNLFEVYAIEVNGTVLVDNVFNSGNDSLVDSPTNYGTDTGAGGEVRGNYATLNPLNKGSNVTLLNGNLDFSYSAAGGVVTSTFPIPDGKWYWEFSNPATYALVGCYQSGGLSLSYLGSGGVSFGFTNGGFLAQSGVTAPTGSIVLGSGDVAGFAFDTSAGTCSVYKNGTLALSYTGLTGTWYPAVGQNSAGSGSFNFGQRPFAYTAPSGFKALCTTNLPAPTITKPSTVMDVKLYTGNNSTQAISGLGFSPDLVWIKSRAAGFAHVLHDTVRGANKQLFSNLTNSEQSDTNQLTSFTADGFTLGDNSTGSGGVNSGTGGYAAWAWDAGSSTTTNNSGSISSQVRANPSAGFSVVTYTGTGVTGTVGHGLGAKPSLIIIKNRDSVLNWIVYHASRGATEYAWFNTTGAFAAASGPWNNTEPTSSVFTIGGANTNNNESTKKIVAYCFAPVAGYSAFGSYTGNGSADGPFVYTGFRPRWLMIKRTDTTGSWLMLDAARDSTNVVSPYLLAESAGAEDSAGAFDWLDFTSNGFKHRNTGAWHNASGGTYVYACFAESPFALARAR